MFEQGHGYVAGASPKYLQVVESAVSNSKKALVYDYIDHCFGLQMYTDPQTTKDVLKDLKKISKYL